jgi:hypothetical protein
VNAAFGSQENAHGVFGPDLDAAAIGSFQIVRLRLFSSCAATGLVDGSIDSAEKLEACIDADPHGVLARATALAARRVASRCAGTTIATAFPGRCAAAAPAELLACALARVDCEVCGTLNAADRLGHGCHRFANGVATSYCGTPPPTTQSVARQWDEEALAAIRIDLPRPPVHAKNLFYTAVAMWDAWAAYDSTADAVLHAESPASSDPAGDRAVAISFAAYRVLSHLYALSVKASATQVHLAARMSALGLDKAFTTTSGDTPAAVGNRIAAAVIAHGLADGSNEAQNYADPTYRPVNEPLIVKLPGLDPTIPVLYRSRAAFQIVPVDDDAGAFPPLQEDPLFGADAVGRT